MRRKALLAALAATLSLLAALPAAAASRVELTPVGRLAFPERGYVIDLPNNVPVNALRVRVSENGVPIPAAKVSPITDSGLTFASVLVIDGSESMTGAPYAAALDAVATFIDKRGGSQQVGLLSFNSGSVVLQAPTQDSGLLRAALSRPPRLGRGTHIFDALTQSLALLDRAQASAGSIVLLSDGADTGSKATLDAVATAALRRHVRIFTVGLRSRAFDGAALEALARRTRGIYAEASSVSELGSIFSGLSGKLAHEFVVRYRSQAVIGTPVHVSVAVERHGSASATYVAPKESTVRPFHRSILSRFLLSAGSLVFLGLVAALLVAAAMLAVLRTPPGGLIERVGQFVGIAKEHAQGTAEPAGPKRSSRLATLAVPARLRTRLAADFELARVSLSPDGFILAVSAGTLLALVLLALISPPLVLLAILVPVFAKAWVGAKVRKVRDAFGDQLPEMLQLIASALRTGHSFIGALNVAVDKAPEPIRRELAQVLTDDQIGISVDDSFRRIAARMGNHDMQQVALLAELQRTAGGNAAEVLDTVVETVRERTDVRRLARTLTAQGRISRWVLSVIPVVMAAFLTLVRPELMQPLYASGVGQTALVVSALMVVAGSFWMKKIVDIKV
jgi:tight adherence protein B